MNSVAHEDEDAAQQGQMKGVYEAARRLWNEGPKKVGMVTSKERLLTKEGEVKARWQEHLMEILKRPVPEVDETNVMNDTIVIVEITRRKEKPMVAAAGFKMAFPSHHDVT